MTDRIVTLARWLDGQLEWMRHRGEVDEFLADVQRCARVVRGLARGPAEQKYLGPCGAPTDTPPGDMPSTAYVGFCDGDVYGPRGGSAGRCRLCGAEVATRDREAWLDAEVRSWAFTAADIADALHIPVKTIRSWATDRPESRDHTGKLTRSASPAKLRSYWRTETGIVADWADPPEGQKRERLHYLGDVADLAAEDAARRAEQQSKRARKRAESEEAA